MRFIDSVDEIPRKYECNLLFLETSRLPIFANIYIFESVNFENFASAKFKLELYYYYDDDHSHHHRRRRLHRASSSTWLPWTTSS